ncbi:hypothetical protein [Kamptonema sp. UHCC 0994]|uniref:hypothetical protein n=1 Tax=Kamptonema sp. UHCC 0994 TaxID=3031329 RepID=UPI0023B90A6E|nr:hypothetical protein [Kamptonema sp. UHCC 0994]MDF0554844.1 hypothetical protein [Kamptonema sp. UHCC 0994]
MAYSNFTLSDFIKQFGLIFKDKNDLFANIPAVGYSEYLDFTLKYSLPLASEINTEKARSEMIITPILLELRRMLDDKISLFSGKEFNVDLEKGLNGACDFLISLSESQIIIMAPVIAIVEAKKEDLIGGLGQCAAEMYAAQLFNQKEGNQIKIIYGVMTSGTVWRFLKLEGNVLDIDVVEYYIKDVGKILGILSSLLKKTS